MDRDRFDRQARALGPQAQGRVRAARVLVAGLGGLGCPAAALLAGAGVATLRLADPDRVELTNLHRQLLYAERDVGRPKAEAARDRLAERNGAVALEAHAVRLDAGNARALVAGCDVALDCTDDLAARYALSDACVALGVPLVQAGVAAQEAQVAVLAGRAPDAPCYRCLHPEAAAGPACADEGVLGPLTAAAGALQALWALRLLAGDPEVAPGRLALLDRHGATTTARLTRRPGCPAHVSEGPSCPLPWNAPPTMDVAVHEFAPRASACFILDVREPDEFEESRIPGAVLVPLGELPRRLEELPKDRRIVCVCAVGGRSARATDYLRSRGYDAVNLRGGMRAWLLAGLG
ncbi:MAG: sulfur-carrier protein adenylyltransferase/sulfurtransferase [Thermoplasmata archaeon]|nr:sulfur-carrier protein adenylyltransferase/sulfurtransferase [Thermoplasmata archaeon]